MSIKPFLRAVAATLAFIGLTLMFLQIKGRGFDDPANYAIEYCADTGRYRVLWPDGEPMGSDFPTLADAEARIQRSVAPWRPEPPDCAQWQKVAR